MPDAESPTGICVVVTTFAHPEGLERLVDDLERERVDGLTVRIYDDGTRNTPEALVQRVRRHGWTYRTAAVNHGKHTWWRWWNEILGDLQGVSAGLFVGLQDDIRLCAGFFDRAIRLWASVDDARKASLYLLVTRERSDLGSSCWTPVRSHPAGPVVHTGWVDLNAFLCDRRLFAELDWRLDPVPLSRWAGRADQSSGVGQQISTRAYRLGLGMYRAPQSLVVHHGRPSLMNPAVRKHQPLATIDFVDGDVAARRLASQPSPVLATMASIPSRRRGLERVVGALLPQVDRMGVYLNGYADVPEFLRHPRIEVARSQDSGDRGDAGKFFWAGQHIGYHVVCDDDINYPADYVATLVAGIERQGRTAVVGFHGSVLREPIADYYRSRALSHMAHHVASDTPVHVLATNVLGYHSSAIRITPGDFDVPNIADIWLALLGQRQRVPFVLLRHVARWLHEQPGFEHGSLYVQARQRAADLGSITVETKLLRGQSPWVLGACRVTAPAAAPEIPSTESAARAAVLLPPPVPCTRVHVTGPAKVATLVLPESDHITSAVRRSGTYYERDLLDALREHGVSGTAVDVGAHFGNHTIYLAQECEADRVVAVEPSRTACLGLLEAVAQNGLDGRVVVHQLAVHPTWRKVRVSAPPVFARRGRPALFNSGAAMVREAPPEADGDDIVPAAPLDEILADTPEISVLKIDCGRMSVIALCSGLQAVCRDRPLITVEAATPDERQSVRMLLEPLAYRESGPYGWTPTWLWTPDRR